LDWKRPDLCLKNKEIIQDSLEIIKTYLRDLIIYKYSPEKIINKDLIRKIQYASQKIAVKSLLSKIEAIQTAQKDIRANTNLRLTLEVMMLRLAGTGFKPSSQGLRNLEYEKNH